MLGRLAWRCCIDRFKLAKSNVQSYTPAYDGDWESHMVTVALGMLRQFLMLASDLDVLFGRHRKQIGKLTSLEDQWKKQLLALFDTQ